MTQPKEIIERFAKSIEGLAASMGSCSICHQWTETPVCAICRDSRRDGSVICVVATSQDMRVVEETGVFKGHYHVLGGTLDPLEGRTPDKLSIPSLLRRLQSNEPAVREVILALDADVPGDTTSLYLHKQMEGLNIKISRLARGLPTGAALEYADAHTLADALTNRKET